MNQNHLSTEGKVALAPEGYIEDKKCVWEWDVIGLWSLGNWYETWIDI